ncbi:hypothetical protein SAMN05216436_114110 [bacterium A37T11]|nr:hypothetical protein SAMN05216436_114110 [bacterium A37T11]
MGLFIFMANSTFGQQRNTEISTKNTWIKAGIDVGLPIGDLADRSTFTLGAEVKGQLMSTPHWGLGVTSGYTHYFPKDENENFGSVPVGIFARYYPKTTGFFLGADGGYSFQTGSHMNSSGGFYVKPQLGYHNKFWNIFGFYNNVFRSDGKGGNIQYAGIGTTFNIMFD